MSEQVDLYTTTYASFESEVREAVRRETYGEDIGQSSWLTADEYRTWFQWLDLDATRHVLEVASGSGGPALFMARETGCRITGVDINSSGIATANDLARAAGLESRTTFREADARQSLDFPDGAFDVIVCIDSIIHIPGRPRLFADWYRLLRPGGRILYTDTVVVTGLVSNEELAVRSSIGYFLFGPPGENERLLAAAGFALLRAEDRTENMAEISRRWYEARERWREDLMDMEGAPTYSGLQRFLDMVNRLATERRLSRIVFLAERPGD